MNKKGFTIIELMAVLIIIAILATLVIGVIIRYSDDANDTYYESLKKQIDLAGKSYYSDNPKIRPHGEIIDGQKVIGKKLYVNELLQNNYLTNAVVGANGEDCNESYLVVKMKEGGYEYDVCLICNGIAYNDKEDKICEITDDELVININNDVNFDVEDTSVPTCVIKATPEEVSKEKTLEIVSSNKNIEYSFDDIIYGANKTKEINNAGTYKAYVKGKYGKGECSITLTDNQVDNKKPVCSIEITGTGNTRTLTLKSNDNDLAEKPYLFEGGSYDNVNTKVVTSAGTYKGYVKDKVGNISDVCIAVVSFDNEGPIIDISKTGGVGTATINATISDISNVAGYTITNDTTTPTSWTSVDNLASTSAIFTKTSAGTYYVHAIDSLGNTNYKEVSLSLSSNGSCSCSRGAYCCWGVATHHINMTTGESYVTHDTVCDYNEKKCGCGTYASCWLS